MTNREFFVAIANSDVNDELIAKANELIASLDHKNDLRKSKDSKEKIESANRRKAIKDFFSSNPISVFTREQIAEQLDFTVGQITSACSALVKDGFLEKSEIKVDKSKKMAYSLNTKTE